MSTPAKPGVRGPVIATIQDITLADLLARCEDDGDCLIWQGYADRIGSPQWRVGGACWPVRRLLWVLTRGAVPAKHQVAVSCGERGCVHPDHLVCRSRSRLQMGQARSQAVRIRIALTKRARNRSPLTAEIVAAIRASAETSTALEQRYGLPRGRASKVRRGETWRDYANPFAGLINA